MRSAAPRTRPGEKISASSSSRSVWSSVATSRYWSTTRSQIAYSTAAGPCASSSGCFSSSARRSLSGLSSPCRTVITYESPRKIISSPMDTVSSSEWYPAVFRTVNTESW